MAARGGRSGLHVWVLDRYFDDLEFQLLIPSILAIEALEDELQSLPQLVAILGRLKQQRGCEIDALTIVNHGNATGFWIGRTWISAATVQRHRADLRRLGDEFASGHTRVAIHSAEGGTNVVLLSQLRSLWPGTAVVGRVAEAMPYGVPGPRGRIANAVRLRARATPMLNEDGSSDLFYW